MITAQMQQTFNTKLTQLLAEFGCVLTEAPSIDMQPARKEDFIPQQRHHGVAPDMLNAQRDVYPARLTISVGVESFGAWHHVSGDDRRLHPDLRS